MPTLREVKKRIRSVVSTKRITKAMQMVAAAYLRRAQQRIEQARPYARKMDEMLSHLAAASRTEIVHPYFEEREPKKKRTLVVIASDRGLCGSFNANVYRRAMAWLNEHKEEAELEIVAIGKRPRDYFRRRPWPIVRFEGDWRGQLDYGRTRQLVAYLTNRFVSGETDEISLVFTRFHSLARYQSVTERYLPVPRPAAAEEGEGAVSDYIFEPSAEEIYAALMPSYATTKMVTALADSFASEHASRMIAMENATNNAGEMVDALTLDYNKARQAQITKEILDIVGGAEALRG
jgi:F-type H+-transporting ATPase subunit gamma